MHVPASRHLHLHTVLVPGPKPTVPDQQTPYSGSRPALPVLLSLDRKGAMVPDGCRIRTLATRLPDAMPHVTNTRMIKPAWRQLHGMETATHKATPSTTRHTPLGFGGSRATAMYPDCAVDSATDSPKWLPMLVCSTAATTDCRGRVRRRNPTSRPVARSTHTCMATGGVPASTSTRGVHNETLSRNERWYMREERVPQHATPR
jgi:hypothetical protein